MEIEDIKNEIKRDVEQAKNIEDLRRIRKKYLEPRRGELSHILGSLKDLPQEKKAEIGRKANLLKKLLGELLESREKEFSNIAQDNNQKSWVDITAPGQKVSLGHLHPITKVQRLVEDIFQSMGFSVVEGPEIESEWYNFDALNIPKEHPARDMWDTFWLKEPESQNPKLKNQKSLLRTHTSPVQIHYMEKHNPPLRVIAPGRIFRYEATDASHEINFYQVEGLMVDEKVTAANFKAIMEQFFERFFKKPTQIRLRPSYFPFTEPSFEIDVLCPICQGKGCSVCSHKGWIEIAGAGMVHPHVFEAVKLNPKNWQGFAFGIGLDRLAMIKYKINDIRLFYSGDLRFLEQF